MGTFLFSIVQYLAGDKLMLATGQVLANFVSGHLTWAALLENYTDAVKMIFFSQFSSSQLTSKKNVHIHLHVHYMMQKHEHGIIVRDKDIQERALF